MKQLLRKAALAVLPRSMRITSRLSDGTLVSGRNRPGHGGRGIYIYRESIEPEYEHVRALMEGREVFVDIGASTGIYALRVARHLPQNGVVLAIEPNPLIAADLFHGIQLNRLNNVRLRVYSVTDATEPTDLWMNDNRPNRFSISDRGSGARAIATFSMPLDEIVTIERLQSVDYIKIDAEGAGESILKGAQATIGRFKPLIQYGGAYRGRLPCLQNYRTFRLGHSRNRLMLHCGDDRLETVAQLGFRELAERAMPAEAHAQHTSA